MDQRIDLVRQLLTLLTGGDAIVVPESPSQGMIGKYVIVRCRDAGVHAGVLVARSGRECELRDSRRLWYWKVPAGKGAFLSGVAKYGLGEGCKIGTEINVTLTESCEVIECLPESEKSIRGYATHERS